MGLTYLTYCRGDAEARVSSLPISVREYVFYVFFSDLRKT